MKKRNILYLFIVVIIVVLVGIHVINQNKPNKNYISVYNNENKLERTITNQNSVDYLSDFYGDKVGDNSDNGVKIPENSKIMYKIEIKQTKPHAKAYFNLYQNNYANTKVMMGMKDIVWKVSPSDKVKILKSIQEK